MDRKYGIAGVLLLVAVVALVTWHLQRSTEPPSPDTAAYEPPTIPGASLLDGLEGYHYPITANAEAQRWFNQGMVLTWGFNHDAAARSFLMGTAADPGCAMCWWGAALVLGPHVNAPMAPEDVPRAWTRIQMALKSVDAVTPRERAYIEALAARYAEQPSDDRSALDRAWADAIGKVVEQYPDDLDAATLYAEALMDLQPWAYYDADGQPRGRTPEIIAVLESVMARNPDHPGAMHLYIHAVEASSTPERGVAAADRLREVLPGAGHLVHMPAHIYTRVGRYHDAVVANQKAIDADDAYLAICNPAPGVYPLGYVPHNHHYLWWAASMLGSGSTALAAADETAKRAWIPELIRVPELVALQDFWVTPLKARVQFGRWDELLETPAPPPDLAYPTAIWHFSQGMAKARRGEIDAATPHLEALAQAASDPVFEKMMIGPQHALSTTLKIAERLLVGTIAAERADFTAAVAALEQGVALEDAAAYFEPPLWHAPVRQTLGAVMLAQGQAADAEAVYREDLHRNPNNGWSLFGLERSLREQGRDAEADAVSERFDSAWSHADLELESSRI
jgi:tetratricopeptide (TPR) repeat protein